MLTLTTFKCPNCQKEDHQKILFIGSEFSYRCVHCDSVHCFLENLFWDFTDNFNRHGCGNYKWSLNRYIGTINSEGAWTGTEQLAPSAKGDYVSEVRIKAREFFRHSIESMKTNHDITRLEKIKLSNKQPQTIYIANAICTEHFQDCLRAIVRIKEHTQKEISKDTYNILILDQKTKFFVKPFNKIMGLDEIWYVDWSPIFTWNHGMDNIRHISKSVILNNSINIELDKYQSLTRCISKNTFPSIYGTDIIKDLFQNNKMLLKNSNGIVLNKKYIAVLIHSDDTHRAGLASAAQLQDACALIKKSGLYPIIVACTDSEINMAKSVNGEEILIAHSIEKQACFYQNYCMGVVGTNCSGCNIPCLYNIPLFTMAKGRVFPDDFYSMGRLLSTYDCKEAFFGKLTKPTNVIEIPIDPSQPTSIMNVQDEFFNWITLLINNQNKTIL
jgi:hypothetical protein